MLKLNYDLKTHAVLLKCSGCGGVVAINVSSDVPPSLLAKALRAANARLTNATSHCPGCKGK